MTARTALVQGSDEPTTAALVRRLTADGFSVTVTGGGDPQGEVDRAAGSSGSLDALVCTVGRPPAGPLADVDPAEWYAGVMACLTPAFRLVRAGVPALRRSGSGRIVLLGSGWTTAERPGQTAASAVHGAVVALTKTLARDLGPDGITVNEVVADPADPALPETVAEAVSYLCGPAAGTVVGQLLTLGTGGALRP
jgi:NAD(P)-dependent dehydrogenase (short-subunit alcohol dehydrogenase family)